MPIGDRGDRATRVPDVVDDPYHVRMPTAGLSRLAEALNVVDEHAELNHRYRKLIHDSRELLVGEEVRLTQARGMAKKLMVLVRAAGTDFRECLTARNREVLDAGLAQADELVYGDEPRTG
ncbi:hypothetical protein DFQ14_101150 [Halopolyspora algeriensis]|uniref:Uncharacterized protein n=1 Tax=Halopolyspora algeriensis TaxID=1500506 RepID=A0A368VXY1_9ACTN|nr:hypothetical protein [Halopolyspora algeriensis]RCW46811.1 hypothetical protein DFQ14_101150 [Halopolyspora algeriensis]